VNAESSGPFHEPGAADSKPHHRRPRYAGKNPRKFEHKYKELNPGKYAETVARVIMSGKTPAGMHRPIMVREILEALDPKPGSRVVDCTLGYGGHALEILRKIQPGGRLIGMDVDPIEQLRTEERLRALGFGEDRVLVRRSNFAGLPKVLRDEGWTGADCILADLGVSSMQIDTPGRGFSIKAPGPLDMRMNPNKGQPASVWISRLKPDELATILIENSDEPHAALLAGKLAGKHFRLTTDLTSAVQSILADFAEEQRILSARRVFQALRIAVNDELTALETLLRHLPDCLNPGGRVAVLTFHSGEDRRVKTAFKMGLRDGRYRSIADGILRPSSEERRANPRAASAKLRWAIS
jgi:16S rRNA (cytosine1402-N4)-methyltransferase